MRVLDGACELLSRIHIGQFDRVLDEMALYKGIDLATEDTAGDLLNVVKRILFPGLASTETFGIGNPEVADRARVAYDLRQVIGNAVAWSSVPPGDPRPTMQTMYDEPHQLSEEPLPACEWEEVDE